MYKPVQIACAVLLIASSIALAFLQACSHGDIAGGVLIYIAQAFLLAASIFGLDAFAHNLIKYLRNAEKNSSERAAE